jgi:peptidoglycan/xylan/chitin deacetylase (PgdA/CDA1 family)
MPAPINVLMYHSISAASGPTSIPLETFRGQIETLAACKYQTVSLGTFKDWQAGKMQASARSVVITFDDGFADFADCAFQILKAHSYTATVFLPSGKIGGTEDWDGPASAGRKLMTWSQIHTLAKENIEFGGHSVNHRDLTKLSDIELEHEVRQCRDDIGKNLGSTPAAFAPPYGRAGARELRAIQSAFSISVGTRLDRADQNCDLYDVPRIEMHYFRDLNRWRDYLEGRAEWYLQARRFMRGVRGLVTH